MSSLEKYSKICQFAAVFGRLQSAAILCFVVVVFVTGLLKKRYKQTTIFIFLWSAIAVVFNIPPNNRYDNVIMKYSSICISTDQYFHETL